MKILLCYIGLAIIMPTMSIARIKEIRIGVNGLTCSQCTRNVEIKLRQLSFVSEVHMNLEHTNGILIPKPGAQIIPEAIAKAVTNAGFSLRYLKVVIQRPGQYKLAPNCLSVSGMNIQLAGAELPDSAAVTELQLLGKDYQPKREILSGMKGKCSSKPYFAMPANE